MQRCVVMNCCGSITLALAYSGIVECANGLFGCMQVIELAIAV